MRRPAFSTHLSPDELKKLAETQVAQAMRLETGPERLTVLTVADALMNLAEIKKLLLEYERRLLNREPREPYPSSPTRSLFHPVQFGTRDEILQGMNVAHFAGAQDELLRLLAIAFAQRVLANQQ
jgi:hypothetical protein